jgi:DNA-binding transcriptional LysR family regulator
MLPELDELRCFLAAAERLHFRTAARLVALSPAAFSDNIKRLEQTLGERLFVRSTRQVRLSAAGERLLPHARACVEAAERCAQATRSDAAAPAFELTLGTRYELGNSWLVPALSVLGKQQPARQIHLYFGDTPELLRKLAHAEIDALISSARLMGQRLSFAPLHEEHYVFVASPRLLERHPCKRPEHAAQHVLLDTHDDLPLFRYFRDARPADENWQFRSTHYLGTISALRARALEGVGVAVLPHYFVRNDLAQRRLLQLFPRTRLPSDWFRLVWQARHRREAALLELSTELARLPLR